VTNCSLTSTSSALKLGTESFGDFRHITFSNCAINNTNRGLGIIVRDGGTVSNVLFSDITMTLDRKHFNWWGNADPIWLVVKKRNPDSKIGNIKNVVFENIVAHGQGTSKLEGYPGHPLKNITLNQVQFFMHPEDKPDKRATHCLQAHDIQGLKIKDCDITWDKDNPEKKWKSAIYLEKLNNFRLSEISAVQGAPDNDFPVFELNQVQNGRVYNCYAKEGSSTFVKVEGKNTRNIYFRDNFTDLASKDFNPGNEVKQETLHGIDR
jgi:hypothetical protein